MTGLFAPMALPRAIARAESEPLPESPPDPYLSTLTRIADALEALLAIAKKEASNGQQPA